MIFFADKFERCKAHFLPLQTGQMTMTSEPSEAFVAITFPSTLQRRHGFGFEPLRHLAPQSKQSLKPSIRRSVRT